MFLKGVYESTEYFSNPIDRDIRMREVSDRVDYEVMSYGSDGEGFFVKHKVIRCVEVED